MTRALVGTNWDITEQRRLHLALFEEKERLHITLRSIGDAVICTDRGHARDLPEPHCRAAAPAGAWTPRWGQPLEQVFRIVDELTGVVIPEPGGTVPCNRCARPTFRRAPYCKA